MQKIYVVEDDDNIRGLVTYALSSAGFEAEGFPDGESFYKRVGEAFPDLTLLDIMLPGEDGISILKRLRASSRMKKIPIILVTAKNEEIDKLTGLDLGADDYITKPFSVMEIISRIRAVLRRTTQDKSDAVLRVGGLALDEGSRRVELGDREIALTYKEFSLLQCLMKNVGLVMSREKLLDQVWGYDFSGESRTVDMHVKALRQKLGMDVIETVRGVGYRIVKS